MKTKTSIKPGARVRVPSRSCKTFSFWENPPKFHNNQKSHMNRALGEKNTDHKKLVSWVEEMAKLCQPDDVFWCDGSETENTALCELMVKSGTFTRLDEKKRPGSFLARSHPSDVARVEDRT